MKAPKVFLALFALLLNCGVYDTMAEGLEHSNNVATEIEEVIGSKPYVSFNWSNGSFASINVTFNNTLPDKPVSEIVAIARESIISNFEEYPEQIIVSFTISGNTQK